MVKADLEREFNREFISVSDNWKTLCPFHDERTPSFLVHKEELIGNCFACGASGYIENLLSQYKGITVSEARKELHIDVVEQALKKGSNERAKTPEIFPESWLSAWPKRAHKYILDRYPRTDEALELLKSTGARFDPSQNRQVFPHRREDGSLIGACGRACDSRQPKWYFYWAYKRGTYLYRPWTNNRSSCLILVEGILDVLRLKMAGLKDDIACPIGTKPGKGQIREIKEYKTVLIGFDNDSQKLRDSGRENADLLYQKIKKSCQVYFIEWPANDPMEMESDDDIHEAVGSAKNYVQRNTLLRAETSC